MKLKLQRSGVASKAFWVAPVFIHGNGLLLSDIIIEDMQHAKPEFLYEDSDIKSAKTSVNLDSLHLLGQPIYILLKFTQYEEVQDLLVGICPTRIR